jgi:predicted DNA-binding WGR domain protein
MTSRKLVFQGETTRKFWSIEMDGATCTVRFGKVGSVGQSKSKTFGSTADCRKAVDKAIAEKLKDGYVDSAGDDTSAASPPVPSNVVRQVAARTAGLGFDLETLEPSARFRRFVESGEYKKTKGLRFTGVAGWSATSRFRADDLTPSFDPFDWNDLRRSDWPGYVALCALHEVGARQALNEFIATDARHPECPVYVWQHEVPEFVQLAPSLDAFLAALVKKAQKLPAERLDVQLDSAFAAASTAFDANQDEKVLAILSGPLEQCGTSSSYEVRQRAERCFDLRGKALDRLQRFAEAAAAYERAGTDGSRRLTQLRLTVLDDPQGAIAAASACLAADWFFSMSARVEACLRSNDAVQAETDLRHIQHRFELQDAGKIREVRTWLESYAGKGEASSAMAKEFLGWFKALSDADVSAEVRAANRTWWNQLARYGTFWEPLFRQEMGIDATTEPTDLMLFKLHLTRHLTIGEENAVTDVMPLAPFTALQSLEFHGIVTTLEPLRNAEGLQELTVNDREIRGLRLPNPHNGRLLEAAGNADAAAVMAALQAGADPNAKEDAGGGVRSALQMLLQHVSDPADPKFALAQQLIQRGAYPYVDLGHGVKPPGCYGAAADTLQAWLHEQGIRPKQSTFREWHACKDEDAADFLELETADGQEIDKRSSEPLNFEAGYMVKASSGGGTRVLDFHTVYLSSYCFVSERLQAFLSTHAGGTDLRFCPVEIRSGKKVVSRAHLLMEVPILDALDEAGSDPFYRWGQVSEVRQLVIDESRIPAHVQMFRLTTFPSVLIVRAQLAEKLATSGCGELDLRLPR